MIVPRNLFSVAVVIGVVIVCFRTASAASAVAVGQRADGKILYGYCFDPKGTESAVRNRAIGYCLAGGGLNPKIIASTGRQGWGAIFLYSGPGRADNFVAVVGLGSEQEALNAAAKKAKAAGGRTARLVRGWHDLPSTTYNL